MQSLFSTQGQGANNPPDFAARILTCDITTHQLIFGAILLLLNLILVPIFSFLSMSCFLRSWAEPIAGKANPLLGRIVEGPTSP